MIKNIIIDIPQLIVLPQDTYHGISKRFIDVLNEYFLWSYLSPKFSDFSVRHALMNEQIRRIFFTHYETIDLRTDEETYSMDAKHYTLLFLGEQVSKGISSIASELMYTIYFMKRLQTDKRFAERIEVDKAIQFVVTHEELKSYFLNFTGFIHQVKDTQQSFDIDIVRPEHDYLMEETEPVYFVTRRNGTLIKYELRKFIETYNSFFLVCKEVLRHHSLIAIAIGLDKWKE